MKKRWKDILIVVILVALLSVCIGLIFSPSTYSANAEEMSVEAPQDSADSVTSDETSKVEETPDSVPENGLIPETEGSKWFSETLMPLILQYGAALLGVLSAGIVLLRKIIKTVKELKEAKNLLKSSDEHNKTSLENMNAFETRMQEQYDEYTKLIQKKLDEVQAGVVADVRETKKAVNKLLAVERRAYLDSPALVSEGTARKIAEVFDETEDEAKSET